MPPVEESIEWPSRDVYRWIFQDISSLTALLPEALRARLATTAAGNREPGSVGTRSTTLAYDCERNHDDIPRSMLRRVCSGESALVRIDYSPEVRQVDPTSVPKREAALELNSSYFFWDEAQRLLASQAVDVIELSADREFVLARSGHFPFQQRVWAIVPPDATHLVVVYLNIDGREQSIRQSVSNITVYFRR